MLAKLSGKQSLPFPLINLAFLSKITASRSHSSQNPSQQKRLFHYRNPPHLLDNSNNPSKTTIETDSPPIPQTLRPTNQTQQTKALRLHLDRDVEVLGDRIRAERHPARRPQEHHDRREPLGVFSAIVGHDLRDELDAPEYGADGAKDVGGEGDGGLGSHFLFWVQRGEDEGERVRGDFVLFVCKINLYHPTLFQNILHNYMHE